MRSPRRLGCLIYTANIAYVFSPYWGVTKFESAAMDVDETKIRAFETAAEFGDWLRQFHADQSVIWLKMYKKKSGIASVNWEEAVIEALAWGWIDGLKKSNDAVSWFQRFTPRKAKSSWSKKNCAHVEKLISDGRMQKAGLRAVEAAKADGRWAAAYAGSSDMEMPEDFLNALSKNAQAKQTFDGLNRQNLFAIYHRLHSAKKAETRQNRMDKIIEMLSRGEVFH